MSNNTTTETTMGKAFEAGETDGAEWVRDLKREARECEEDFDPADVEAGLRPGNYSADDGLINAVTSEQLYDILGLAPSVEWGSDEWRAALDEYNWGFAAGARAEAAPAGLRDGEGR